MESQVIVELHIGFFPNMIQLLATKLIGFLGCWNYLHRLLDRQRAHARLYEMKRGDIYLIGHQELPRNVSVTNF